MDWNDTEAVDDIATPAAHNLLWRLEGAEILASTANDPISSPMGRPGLAVSQTQNLVSGKGEPGYSGDMARSALIRELSVATSDGQGDDLPASRHPFEADGQGPSLPAPIQPIAVAGQPHGSGGGGSAGCVACPELIGADVESTEAGVEGSAKVAAHVPLSVVIEDLAVSTFWREDLQKNSLPSRVVMVLLDPGENFKPFVAHPSLTERSCRPAAMHTLCIYFRLEFIFLHKLDHLCAVCEIIFGDSRMGAVRHKKWKNSHCCAEDRPEARLAKSRNLQCCGGQTIVGSQEVSSLWTELQVSGTRSRLRPSRKLRLDNS